MASVDDLLDHLEGNSKAGPPTSINTRMDMKSPKLWYHGKLSRTQTEKLLLGRPSGSFLVRDSTSSAGDYVLSVCEHGRISHYIVANKGNGYKIGEKQFSDLPSVIDFYKKQILDTTTLTIPVDVENPDASIVSQTGNFLAVVVAMHDFAGTDAEDLPFTRNEVLRILQKNDENWWLAENSQGKTGSIPCTYVKVIPSSSPSIAPPIPESPRPSGANSSQKSRLERTQSVAPSPGDMTAISNELNSRLLRSSSDASLPGDTSSRVIPASSGTLRRGSNVASPGSPGSASSLGEVKKIVKIFDPTGLFKSITVSHNLYLAKNVKEAAMQKFAIQSGKWCLYEANGNTERLLDDNVSILDLALKDTAQEYKLLLKEAKDSRPAPATPANENNNSSTKFRSSDPRVIAQALAVMNRAANPYDPTALAFNIGDIIDVTEMNETGLWRGIVNGKYGHFPMTAADLVEDNQEINSDDQQHDSLITSSSHDMLSEFDAMNDQLKNL